jgi:hypothetical protein
LLELLISWLGNPGIEALGQIAEIALVIAAGCAAFLPVLFCLLDLSEIALVLWKIGCLDGIRMRPVINFGQTRISP